MESDWLFEGEESFPALGGMKQRTQIGEFGEFGRGLILDGQVQLAEKIDSLYTTALVFPGGVDRANPAQTGSSWEAAMAQPRARRCASGVPNPSSSLTFHPW